MLHSATFFSLSIFTVSVFNPFFFLQLFQQEKAVPHPPLKTQLFLAYIPSFLFFPFSLRWVDTRTFVPFFLRFFSVLNTFLEVFFVILDLALLERIILPLAAPNAPPFSYPPFAEGGH